MLDAAMFDSTRYAEDVVGYMAMVTETTAAAPWPPEDAATLRAAVPELMAMASPGGVLYRSPRARDIAIPVAGDSIRGRVIDVPGSAGLYVHLHGGGWTVGGADLQDGLLERTADATGQTVVSVDYRMAPEHAFPVPLDDVESAARWLMEQPGLGAGAVITLGGGSAGANLALATAVRLRDRPGAEPVAALNLLYGSYDLTLTPSARSWGARNGVLTTAMLEWFYDQYVADFDRRRDPEISPLFAELAGLPPTLVTVGSEDLLRDDSLFLYTRLVTAGVSVELQVVPGAGHAFDTAPLSVTPAANERIDRFLAAVVDAGRARRGSYAGDARRKHVEAL